VATSEQDLEQGNGCDNAFCTNNVGSNGFTARALDQTSIKATGKQDVEQGNEYNNGASCENHVLGDFKANDIDIQASEGSSVDANSNQELIEQNSCEDLNTLCQNNERNTFL
jgi:hypothetical protein